jgi:VIT1/CCC1 family predicted Fe2+/Mn2+ transporter/rubrerythrin
VDIAQSLENLRLERDAVALYDALATIEKDPRRAAAFRHIADNERRHAEIWADRLRELGATVPPPTRPRARVRFIILAARLLGTRAVSDLVKALEGDEVEVYDAQETSPEVASIAADEREHAEIWKRLDAGGVATRTEADGAEAPEAPGLPEGSDPATTARPPGAPATEPGVPATSLPSRRGTRSNAMRLVTAREHPPVGSGDAGGPEEITKAEGWHRSARSGTLRAVIFGVSDGLVSNLALVMGVAGAAGGGSFVLLAGVAGLLAGAFSMAAGEYISMQSQRELFERQIELERAELDAMPDEEQRELVEIYVSKGLPRPEAERVAARMFEDPETALDTLVREELGLDPDELGSPWGAAAGSFLAFAIGAVIPVAPYLFAAGTIAFAFSLGLSLIALFAVGAGVSMLTGKGVLFSGFRQLGIGAAAAAVTYLVGSLIGVGVAG